MLLTPFIRRQLWVFGIISAIALGLTVFTYTHVPAMLGIGVYDVKVDFTDTSGLYPQANVTYRGAEIGKVTALEVGKGGAVVTLRLRNSAHIPAQVSAQLHSTSAIGEQYVDLVPSVDHGPYLHEGSVIGTAQSVTMPQIGPVIDRLNKLLDSVPRQQTADVLHQLDAGLGGAGQDLGDVVDSSSRLVEAAQRQLRDTHDLIDALDPVLRTQIGLRNQTAGYASSLAGFTGALAKHDRQLRELIRAGSPGLEEANGLVADLQPQLPSLLGNLATVGAVTRTYLPNLTQILVVYPATVARLQSAVNPRAAEGDVQLDLRATVNDPPSCITGYLSPTERRVPGETSVRAVNGEAHCAVASADPRSVRGDRNLPCPNSTARAALPAGCGLDFGSGIAARSTTPTVDTTGAVREARARLEALRWMRILFGRTA